MNISRYAAAWVRNAPAFITDSAMQGFAFGCTLSCVQSVQLYGILPKLILMTSPTYLALAVGAAALARHTVANIATEYTQGQTNTRITHRASNWHGYKIEHILGPYTPTHRAIDVNFAPKHLVFQRAILVGELALILLMLGGGLSIAGIVSIFGAKVFSERLGSFFFLDYLQQTANKSVQDSYLQTLARKFSDWILSQAARADGHRLGDR